ncbi:MAG: hypothetical protein J6B54_05175 [Clostridia bacterium]|nr:hypothetical protein [Clostridia bacterium]
MPNHVINRLEFDCPEEMLKEILSAICYDNNAEAERTGIGTIDFNKITPMPPSLDIESGSNTNRGIDLYLTSVNPGVKYYGKEKMDSVEFAALEERLSGSRTFFPHNSALTPDEIQKATAYHSEEELVQLGKTAVENLMQYGATTWYDWRTRGDTWNTKWNSYNAYDYNGGNEICFQTAWSAPHPIIEKLSAMYPEVTIKHRWANEDLWQGCGSQTYLGGEMIDHDYPETDMEHLEIAASIWDSSLEDYGLVENASGTSYVNIENEIYDLVSVCGQPGLFSNGKLTKDDIPRGLFVYHLRSGSNDEQFCAIENRVSFNHGGSIVTSEPLDLGKGGSLSFDDNHTLNFMGEDLTFGQFMEGDFETREVVDLEQN